MAGASKPELSNEEKILLCLLQHSRQEERVHVPQQLTQRGLADSSGIRVNHIPRAVGRLVERGELEEFTAYVHGSKRRRKAYVPTDAGRKRALEVAQALGQTPVVKELPDGSRKGMTLAELHEEFGKEHSLITVLDRLSDDCVFEDSLMPGGHKRSCISMISQAPLVKGFVGRERELVVMRAWQGDGAKPLLVISGAKGMGKSWLIGRYLAFSGNICNCIYIDAGNAKPYESIARQLEEFVVALGIKADASTPESFVETALKPLAERNVLIVIDSLTNTAPDTERFAWTVGSHAGRLEGLKVIFLTRQHDIIRHFPSPDLARATKVLQLTGLDRESARRILEKSDMDDDELDLILDLTKGNPLAMSLVFSEEINKLVEDAPDLTVRENLMLRCLKAMDYVLTG